VSPGSAPGPRRLGPADGRLTVHTRRGGLAARAGHDLELEVGVWEAELTLGDGGGAERMQLSADARSLRVAGASGGAVPLGDRDRREIARRVDEEVLRGGAIAFRSTRVTARGDGRFAVDGELELVGGRRPVSFQLAHDATGRLTARATISLRAWGIDPPSALRGALRVLDEIDVVLDARLPPPA
jgi:hypothetical protein